MEKSSAMHRKMLSESDPPVISVSITPDVNLQNAVEQFEQQYIREVLMLNRGRKDRTARMLGLNRKTLYKKLKKYALA